MEQVVARKANRVFLVDPADAVFFYMDNGIVRVRVENDTYWVNYHLGELEDALAPRGFFRARRSSLVNLKLLQADERLTRLHRLLLPKSRTGAMLSCTWLLRMRTRGNGRVERHPRGSVAR